MPRPRRTMERYKALYRSPKALFSPTAASGGVETILFPNGEPEIWFKADGQSVSLVASAGPYGLGLTIRTHLFSPLMTVRSADLDYAPLPTADGAREVGITLYRDDPKSQAFKRWYSHLGGPGHERPQGRAPGRKLPPEGSAGMRNKVTALLEDLTEEEERPVASWVIARELLGGAPLAAFVRAAKTEGIALADAETAFRGIMAMTTHDLLGFLRDTWKENGP